MTHQQTIRLNVVALTFHFSAVKLLEMVHMYHILRIFIFFNVTNVVLKCSSGKIFSLICAIFYKSNNMCSFDIIEKLILIPAYTSNLLAYTFASCMEESTNGTQVNVGCQASCVSGTLC